MSMHRYLVILFHAFNLILLLKLNWVLGWDRKQYCTLQSLAASGGNPYDYLEVLQHSNIGLFLTYPPSILPFFEIACTRFEALWFIGDIILYLFLALLVLTRSSSIAEHIIFALNFGGMFVGCSAGNIQLYESTAFSVALVSIVRRRYAFSGIALGIAVFIKLQTIILLPLLFLGLRGDWSRVVKVIGGSLSTALLLHVVSYLLFPKLEMWYWRMLYEQAWLQKTGILIDIIQPTLRNLSYFIWPGNEVLPQIMVLSFFTVAIYLAYSSRGDPQKLFLSLLFGFACFPRLAYYSFSLMVVPLVRLTSEMPKSYQLGVAVLSTLPVLLPFLLFKNVLIPGYLVLITFLVSLLIFMRGVRVLRKQAGGFQPLP